MASAAAAEQNTAHSLRSGAARLHFRADPARPLVHNHALLHDDTMTRSELAYGTLALPREGHLRRRGVVG